MFQKILVLSAALSLGACAVGNTFDYAHQSVPLSAKSDKTVAVGVHDQRPTVVSGENTPEWVGWMRSGVGIPYGIHTTSGKPLADDLSSSIVDALKANGIHASAVTIALSSSAQQATTAVTAAGADRDLVITIRQWQSDKYLSTSLAYSLEAVVLDRAGNRLATSGVGGTKEIDTGFKFDTEHLVLDTGRNAIAQLLNDQKIIDALR